MHQAKVNTISVELPLTGKNIASTATASEGGAA